MDTIPHIQRSGSLFLWQLPGSENKEMLNITCPIQPIRTTGRLFTLTCWWRKLHPHQVFVFEFVTWAKIPDRSFNDGIITTHVNDWEFKSHFSSYSLAGVHHWLILPAVHGSWPASSPEPGNESTFQMCFYGKEQNRSLLKKKKKHKKQQKTFLPFWSHELLRCCVPRQAERGWRRGLGWR